MKQLLNKFTIFFLCICLLIPTFLLSGCEEEDYSVYFGAETMPINIDPQKAESYGELLAVRNLFRGLFKEDADGNVVPDLAENYTLSNDKLTYTFKINKSQWNDGNEITANDFKFGIERAQNPETASPSAKLLNNISSVATVDSNTLIIKLLKPDSSFTTLLTSAVFMPCNQAFFEKCQGKYGLNKDSILTNGFYYVKQWIENRHIKISLLNPDNYDNTVAKNIFITVSTTGKDSIKRIANEEIGFTVSTQDYSAINTDKFNIITSFNKSYALIFNKNTEIGKNQLITSAFAKSINKDYYSSRMNQRFRTTENILPYNCSIMFRQVEFDVKYSFKYDPKIARDEFLNAIKVFNQNKLPQINVLYSGNEDIKSILGDVVSQWQSNLGAYVNITALSEVSLIEKVKSGNFTAALVPLSGNAYEILSTFSEKGSGMYINNPQYDSAILNLSNAQDFASAITEINNCLNILSTESTVIPIVSIPTAFIYSNNYNKFNIYKTDGTVNFLYFNKIQ